MNYEVTAPPNRSYVVYQRSTSDVVYKYNSYMMYVYNRCILRESERARERMCDICDICDVCDTCDICDICIYIYIYIYINIHIYIYIDICDICDICGLCAYNPYE